MRGRHLALVVAAAMMVGCAPPADELESLRSVSPTPVDDSLASPNAEGSFPPARDCAVFAPEALPTGEATGEARPFPDDEPNDFQLAWGEGHSMVVVGWGQDVLDESGFGGDSFIPAGLPDEQVVVRDGVERHVVPIGEPPHGQIAVLFVIGDCPYVLWLAAGASDDSEPLPGYTLEEAIDYAGRF